MVKPLIVAVLVFIGIFIIDQNLKAIFLEGYRWHGEYFSLILVYNKGVAFSMLAFLDGNLKYIKLFIIFGIVVYLFLNKDIFKTYCLPSGIILGAGSSNLYDRFLHGGVVDYFHWHKWINYPVFNFADVMISVAVVLALIITYKESKKSKI